MNLKSSCLLIALTAALAPGCNRTPNALTAGGQAFKVEVSYTPDQQRQGLMGRKEIAPDHCMLFLFPKDHPIPIWMKNCSISLDIIWTDAQGRIVEMYENAPPAAPAPDDKIPTYGGTVPARNFIEFQAGTIKRLGLRVGDRLRWDVADGPFTRSKV